MSPKQRARLIGTLLIIQMTGLIVPFIMLHPILPSIFITQAAGAAAQIKIATLLLLANCGLTIGISIAAWPLFRTYSSAMALLIAGASIIMFCLQAADNAQIMSMVSLSQECARAAGPREAFQAIAAVASSARQWSHYSELLVIDAWILLFYCFLLRFVVVPRALAVFGLITVALHFTGITLPLLAGLPSVTLMGPPMALSHLALAAWLITRGFDEQSSSRAPDR